MINRINVYEILLVCLLICLAGVSSGCSSSTGWGVGLSVYPVNGVVETKSLKPDVDSDKQK